MKGEMPMISGEETDMLSRSARRVHRNVSGRAKAAKRSYARRVRQSVRLQVRNIDLPNVAEDAMTEMMMAAARETQWWNE